MASRPSIVFLFDSDLPSLRSGSSFVNGDEDFPSQCIRLLRQIVLNILNYFSEKQVNIQWGYRFYSSSNYQLTNKARFVDLTAQTVEEFEEALDVRFEQNSSSTNDRTCSNRMTGAAVLSRTLQDIISDYEWKPPSDSLTPTRKGKKAGKQLDQSLQNLVFIITEVPSDEAISSFCNFNAHDEPSVKAVTEAFMPKELAKRFQEFQLSLNFIDLCHNQKSMFRKIASNMRGAVINATTLTSPFSFSQILQASCYADESSLEKCVSCQTYSIGSRVFISVQDEHPIELWVQCWNSSCPQSSPSMEDTRDNIPVIKCTIVQKSAVPISSWLKHESLYLLSSSTSSIPNVITHKTSLVGILSGRCFFVSYLTCNTALMVFPSPHSSSFQSWARNLFNDNQLTVDTSSRERSFVENLLQNEYNPYDGPSPSPAQVQESSIGHYLSQLKGNYVEKKSVLLGIHWQILRNCFQEETLEKGSKEYNNNSFDQLNHTVAMTSNDAPAVQTQSNDGGPIKKIGSNRIQNLRASTLLQKSQEVRARNDEMEREKVNREKQVAEERKERVWKEFQTYLLSLRSSIGFGEDMIQPFPFTIEYDKEDILKRCIQLKNNTFSSQLEDWQRLCLVQVIVSTILYTWKENHSMEMGYKAIHQHFLKRSSAVNRSTSKSDRENEFKFQIILRLELSWVIPSLVGEEEDVLQDTTSLFQMLSIHSSPQIIPMFFQDALIVCYENMLPEFLVNLCEELNQPVPSSLSDQVRSKLSTRTPSPALSSKTLSVQSLTSQNEGIGSQKSVTRDFRSRTLSRQPSLNMLQHKKQITLPNKVERVPAPAKKEDSNEVVRVRRSLQFGSETPLQKTRIKSPVKGIVTPRKLETSFEPLSEFTTPCKDNHIILAPETPSRLRSDGKNRKTDGVHVVGESPEVKQEALRRSPRRLEAAIALRRRASFYSSLNSELNPDKGASRNWSRAESQVWSEKAKANASLPLTDDNSQQTGQSARFLFSKILSRNDSLPSNEAVVAASPHKDRIDSADTLGGMGVLCPPTTPSRHRVSAAAEVLAPGTPAAHKTPMKTPMKTPKHVQFNFSFQPATPSSKTLPDPRSILKSPMSFQSPNHTNRTPRKVVDDVDAMPPTPVQRVVHVLDDTNFRGRHQLELHSPVKKEANGFHRRLMDDVECKPSEGPTSTVHYQYVHKLDEKTLRADEEVELKSPSKESPPSSDVILPRRSPRNPSVFVPANQATNFYHHNPDWSVVNYRKLATVDGTKIISSLTDVPRPAVNERTQDPYMFEEDEEEAIKIKPPQRNSGLEDSSSHKRKLFQSSSTEKTPCSKRRRLIPTASPIIEELKTPPPCKFQAPKEGSLFHLENSPLLSSIEAKFF